MLQSIIQLTKGEAMQEGKGELLIALCQGKRVRLLRIHPLCGKRGIYVALKQYYKIPEAPKRENRGMIVFDECHEFKESQWKTLPKSNKQQYQMIPRGTRNDLKPF